MPRKTLCCALMVLFVAVAANGGAVTEREQLPSDATPLHYDLELTPDADNLRFQARVRITLDVNASTRVIVLNAGDLTFDRVVVDQEDIAASVGLDKKLQRATLTFAHPVTT
jgi:aminopeptidase N